MAAPSLPFRTSPTPAPMVDTAAAGFAVACAIHCALAPALLVTATAAGFGWVLSEPFGRVAIACSLALAGWALRRGQARHRDAGPFRLALLALPCFAVAELAHLDPGPTALAAAGGGLVLAAAHLWNRRLLLQG